jgi:hypothetical protein
MRLPLALREAVIIDLDRTFSRATEAAYLS